MANDAAAHLLGRLDAIARSLAATPHALALIGLGSVGRELDRIDEFSDLDFFVIVEPGHVGDYLDSLDWLSAAHPLEWWFRNTADGFKVVMSDGLLCEFAVFEPHRLGEVPFAEGRIVWVRAGVEIAAAPALPVPSRSRDVGWLVGEALTNLLVGLQRWHRGERLAGSRMVQVYAVDRLLDLVALEPGADPAVQVDPFVPERRLEQRRPDLAEVVAACVQGVARAPESALALLAELEARADVPHLLASRIRTLAASGR
jgi:hypothetical protein